MDLDQYIALGLHDPDASDADERLEVLEALARFGASPEELAYINETAGLTWVPIVVALSSSGCSLEEAAVKLDMTAETLEVFLDAAGLPRLEPGAAPFTDDDLDMFRAWAAIADFIPAELGTQLLRAAGASSARIAEAGIATFVEATGSKEVYTGDSDLERIDYNERALEAYLGAADTFTQLLRHHMRAALERWYLAGEDSPRGLVRFCVGFVDLVGYTPLSHQLSIDELSALVDRFEDVALSAAAAHNGRIVKHIGDEVMFVATTAEAALDIALTIVEDFRAAGAETTPRGGVAVGDLLGREGDFYGPAVNLASRISDLAVPEEILVSEGVKIAGETETAGFGFEPAGRRQLKGFPSPVELWAARRALPS